MNKIFTLFLSLLFITLLGRVQPSFSQCGTHMTDNQFEAYLSFKEQHERNHIAHSNAAPIEMNIPLTIHIIQEDDGTGGMSVTEISNSITKLNEDFANIGIQFYVCGNVHYYNDSEKFHYNDTEPESRLESHNDFPNTINIVYHKSIQLDGFGSAGGFAPYPGGSLRITMSQAAGNYTLLHEMGHFWGLPHTFEKSNSTDPSLKELVTRGAGANCSTAGDGICDTPADPFVHSESQSYFSNCIYTEVHYDANGDLYEPMVDNIMSYYNGCTTEHFTQGQYDLMASYKSHPSRSNWSTNCESALAPSNLTAIMHPTHGVQLNWQDNADNELAYELQISIGSPDAFEFAVMYDPNTTEAIFGDLVSNQTIYFRIKALNSNGDYSNITSVTTGNVYCLPFAETPCGSGFVLESGYIPAGIKKVHLDAEDVLDNETACGYLGYEYFATPTVTVYKGIDYRLNIEKLKIPDWGGLNPDMRLWIDLNEDYVFDENTEAFEVHFENDAFYAVLNIDPSVTNGTKRLRIKGDYIYGQYEIDPCSSFKYGETEDYNIVITDQPVLATNINLSASYSHKYNIALTWELAGLDPTTKCIVYVNKENTGLIAQDTVAIGNLSTDVFVNENGNYEYLIRKLSDHSLISDRVSVTVNDEFYCLPDTRLTCEESEAYIVSTTFLSEYNKTNNTACAANMFSFHPSSFGLMYKGLSYGFEVQQYTNGFGNTIRDVNVWIDFNENGIYENDGNEMFTLEYDRNGLYKGVVSCPEGVTSGTKNLRVRLQSATNDITPCDYAYRGETEDYQIEILDVPSSTVNLIATKSSPYFASLAWSSNDNTKCHIYESYQGGLPVILDTVFLNEERYNALLIGNGDYTYTLRNANDSSLISNLAKLTVSNYEAPYLLSAALDGISIALKWNDLGLITDDIVIKRTGIDYPENLNPIVTINPDSLTYLDPLYSENDDEIIYQLFTNSGRPISNIANVKLTSLYCRPTFDNTECLENQNSLISYYDDNDDYQTMAYQYSCFFTNFFGVPNDIGDTLKPTVEYTFKVNYGNQCGSNEVITNERNVKIWIDFNEDFEFTNDEIIYTNPIGTHNCRDHFTYSPSPDIFRGYKRVRFIVTDKNYNIGSACENYTFGRAYDRLVFIDTDTPRPEPENPTVDDNISTVSTYLSSNIDLTLFPNPSTNGVFEIETSEQMQGLIIRDITGKNIYRGTYEGRPKLPQGMYFIEIQLTGKQNYQAKFISQ